MMSIMEARTRALIVAVGVILAGCGGRQGLSPPDDAGSESAPAAATIGPVDLTQAPAQLPLSCDQGIGALAFDNPCLVGTNLSGGGGTGFHETECRFHGMGDPVAWSFVLPLSEIAQNPDHPLSFPSDFPPTPTAMAVDVDGQQAAVAHVAGAVTFSRVDPTARAFSAWFKGTISWTGTTAAAFTCVVDAPFWGAPGGFE
jgi:hypothetical protein